mgnify:CR=1 FL=1
MRFGQTQLSCQRDRCSRNVSSILVCDFATNSDDDNDERWEDEDER